MTMLFIQSVIRDIDITYEYVRSEDSCSISNYWIRICIFKKSPGIPIHIKVWETLLNGELWPKQFN